MNEVHLETPVSDEAIAALELGDVVYLSGVLYTARWIDDLSHVSANADPAARTITDPRPPLPAPRL